VTTVGELLRAAWDARRRGRVEQFTSLVAEATERARAAGSSEDLADALHQQAQIYRDAGEPERAFAPYHEAIALRRRSGSSAALAREVRQLAELHVSVDDLESADVCMVEALALYRELEREAGGDGDAHRLDVANAVRAAALLREAQGRGGEARELWREAVERYADLGLDAGAQEAEARLRD
jgi:tetratricopeptide (TPR) repeat protein